MEQIREISRIRKDGNWYVVEVMSGANGLWNPQGQYKTMQAAEKARDEFWVPESAMNSDIARNMFNKAQDRALANGDLDAVARIELCREYFTNPDFRKKLEAFVFEQTQAL